MALVSQKKIPTNIKNFGQKNKQFRIFVWLFSFFLFNIFFEVNHSQLCQHFKLFVLVYNFLITPRKRTSLIWRTFNCSFYDYSRILLCCLHSNRLSLFGLKLENLLDLEISKRGFFFFLRVSEEFLLLTK